MKKALLIGINSYKGAVLNGCVNDVMMMQKLLNGLDYQVKALVEKNATKSNIMEEFELMLADSKPGDSLVFHYSGHGSQVPDKSGDESDSLDECILPINFTWDNVILDDDINDLLERHNTGAHVEVLLDACHSGSGTRSVLIEPNKAHTRYNRYIQPPKELFDHITNRNVKVAPIKLDNVVLFSGCKDDQTSSDAYIDSQYNGAFTYAFCKNFRINNSRVSSLASIRMYMKANGYEQEPQLTCSLAKKGTPPFSAEGSLLKSLKFWEWQS